MNIDQLRELYISTILSLIQAFAKLDQEVEELQKSKKLITDDFSEKDPYEGLSMTMKFLKKYILLPNAIQPQSRFMIFLVFIQWCAFMYNAWSIPLRFSFHIYQTDENAMKWAFADYSMDLVYLFDTIGKYNR